MGPLVEAMETFKIVCYLLQVQRKKTKNMFFMETKFASLSKKLAVLFVETFYVFIFYYFTCIIKIKDRYSILNIIYQYSTIF